MIKNYLKVAYRGLIRQKGYALINIIGLAMGLSCSILIGLYVLNELSYDKFHTKSDRIYRIVTSGKMGTNSFKGPFTPAPMAEALVRDFPEVEMAVRLFPAYDRCVNYKEKTIYENRFLYTDSTFFQIFDFKFIKGNPATALGKPFGIVLTESTAKKYYGQENPLGKTFKIVNTNNTLYEVTAVIEDMPENSHFHFDFIGSSKAITNEINPYWVSNNNYTYFLLRKGADVKGLEKKFPDMVKRYIGPQIKQFLGITIEDFEKEKNEWKYSTMKLTDIHLSSSADYELDKNGSIGYVYLFSVVALFILLIACINFTNLATARSMNRAKEVGLRKVLGSWRSQLITQFLAESILLCLISVVLAFLLVQMATPAFNNLLGLKLNFNLIKNGYLIPGTLLFTLLVGIIAGSYPAFYLSKFVPVEVLKGKLNKTAKGINLRNSLVVFQFWISIIIILGTFTIYSQLLYLQHKKLGFDKDKLVVIERTDPIKKDIKLFMEELKKNPVIQEVSLSSGVPNRIYSNDGFNLEGAKGSEIFLLSNFFTDYKYMETMGLQLSQGRYFSENYLTDSLAVVINESTVKYLGINNPIGKCLIPTSPNPKERVQLTIIGVLKDFHYEDLRKPIKPMIIALNKPSVDDGYITVRIAAGKNQEALKYMNQTWKKFAINSPLMYFYFDQEYENLYKSEYQTRKIMSFFAIFAIFIACLGLFGLVAYTTEKRTKEIGVRKVLGSSIFNIVGLLSKDTIKLIVIAACLAIPVAWFLMYWWLQNYAYRIHINPLVFVFAALIAITISLFTILFQALKAARRNPVEALRYE
jgi:putative ABC transport system permease protein